MNRFVQHVLAVTRQIPYGRVTTYGAIARAVGQPRAARTVGTVLRESVYEEEFVPAHRVVNRQGMLTGKHRFAGKNMMEEMLQNEHVEVKDNQVVQFERLFWQPPIYLEKEL